MNSAAMIKPGVIKKPRKVIEIDESYTEILFKQGVQVIKAKHESSDKGYTIKRTVKNGLIMIGA